MGQEDLLHTAAGHLGRVVGRGGDGAHAAGVGALVAVKGPLVILGGGHGNQMLPVAESQHGDLRAGHTLLDDHPGAGLAELAAVHHGTGGLLGFGYRLGHDNALAQGQAVSLHHDGRALGLNVGQSRGELCKGLILCGWNVVLGHQILGKDFAGLDDGGVRPGAEGGNARILQGIHHAQGQGIVRRHHYKINGMGLGPGHHSIHVGGGEGDTLGQGGDTAVAGGAVKLFHLLTFRQCPGDGVLPPAAADQSKHSLLTPQFSASPRAHRPSRCAG